MSDCFYPPISELYRMKQYLDRAQKEIEYDILRYKQRIDELQNELTETKRTMSEFNDYINKVEKERLNDV